MAGLGNRLGQDLKARPSRDRSGRRVPRHRRRRRHRSAVGRRSGNRAEKGARTIPPHPGAQRKVVSGVTATEAAPARSGADAREPAGWRPPSHWPDGLPELIVVLAVIIFPWAYTIWMSLHEWKVGAPPTFVGLANYIRLPSDARFVESVWHTLVYTALSVALPLLLGTLAAVGFHAKFPMRGFLRGLFILPMMATPVAIALVWTMMFHPQLGILNYLLSLVGLPPQLWVFHPATVIPSLVLVETWQWTPLVMLIVLGGLAAIPAEPYESAQIDGATRWQIFRYISLPLIMPFLIIASMIRMIDAVKSFDIIFAITQGGPGSASETINLYLYSVAFVYYDVGYASAIVVVFFALIVALAGALLRLQQTTHWNDSGGIA